jgi:phosphoribosylformimino-5-aminoimidazole carboxamide ribotide isomerase
MIDIIPAIDIIDGKCVRLSQGDYSQKKVYADNPVETAKMFEDAGLRRLHLVDLDGARAQHIVNYRVLEQIAGKTDLTVDFGGGLKSDEDLRIAFECGAAMVTGGSIAVKNPEIFIDWIKKYGADKIILGADVKDEKIAVSGWEESTDTGLIEFIEKYKRSGIEKIICTDIRRDGMLGGAAVELYKKILMHFPEIYLVASGGISSVNDIEMLENAGIPAVITGKAIYENKIKLKDLRKFIE